MLRSERGAVLIHVAIALIALLCFLAYVADHGMMLTARRQAQNAADAGALAGAAELMFNLQAYDAATQAAEAFAGAQNVIWSQQTAVADIRVSPLPFACPASAGGGDACIRVDVMRGLPDPRPGGTVHANTFPTHFARFFGIDRQGTRATATAQVAAGNAVNCVKPWIVADRWTDNSATGLNTAGWDMLDIFNPGVDTYAPPGFRADVDYGLQLMLKGDRNMWSSGWSLEIELGGGNGGNTYRDEIAGCPNYVPEIGLYDGSIPCNDRVDQNFVKGCINVRTGVRQGPTEQGAGDLVGLDPQARWDTATNRVTGGCQQDGTCEYSPRIVPIAVFDPLSYASAPCTGNNCVAKVINLMGFFVEGMCDPLFATPPAWCGSHPKEVVVGRLVQYPGQSNRASGSAGAWTFIRVLRLVQ
jgi:hypothetical protein